MQLMFHDDSCGELLDKEGECPKCKYHPDMQSTAFREVSEDELKTFYLEQRERTFLGVGRQPIMMKSVIVPRVTFEPKPVEQTSQKPDGDNFLSANDRNLWELCYGVFLKFQWPVMFKYYYGDSPRRRDGYLSWFVPRGSGRFEEIEAYLKEELRNEIRVGSYDEKIDHYLPGCRLSVFEFAGFEPYLELAPREAMIKGMIKQLFEKLKREDEEENAPKA